MPTDLKSVVQRMIDAGESEENIATVIKGYSAPDTRLAPKDKQSDSGALGLAATARAIPPAANAAMEVATNPNVPRAMATAGRVIGGIAPAVGGAAEAGPVGAAIGLAAASKGAWAGGKTGYFSGKLLQNVTAPVARALTAIEPYLQTVSTLSGAQGVNDLAQMAEPTRQDIGMLGVGPSVQHDDTHPALVNLLAMKASDAIKQLKSAGVSIGDATSAYWTLKSHLLNGSK